MISKKERLELNALSKEVFGSSSRWQKLIDKGYSDVVTEEKTETVPPEKEGDEPTTKTVEVPVTIGKNAYRLNKKYYTVESVKQFMLENKANLDKIKEEIKKQQDVQRESELRTKQLHEEISGSAKV
jgi:hypothetical protein